VTDAHPEEFFDLIASDRDEKVRSSDDAQRARFEAKCAAQQSADLRPYSVWWDGIVADDVAALQSTLEPWRMHGRQQPTGVSFAP
jgi:hypothetical protein